MNHFFHGYAVLCGLFMVGGIVLFADDNLIKNGALEIGVGGVPENWGQVDGLVTRWVSRKDGPGKCLQMDTSVLQGEKKAYQKDPRNFQRGELKGGQYSTVGAHEGAWAYASPVDIKNNDRYFILSADVCSEKGGEPKILIRGFRKITATTAGQNSSWFYQAHKGGPFYSEQSGSEDQRRKSQAGDYLMVYRHTLHCRFDKVGVWQHFELGVKLPSIASAYPDRLLFKPYAYWPNGVYQFDNISFRKATKEAVEKLRSRK